MTDDLLLLTYIYSSEKQLIKLMSDLKFWFTFFFISVLFSIQAQEKKTYKIHTIAFYNLENLFDTIKLYQKTMYWADSAISFVK